MLVSTLKVLSQFLNLLTFGLWSKLGRLTHYAFDAVLCELPEPPWALPPRLSRDPSRHSLRTRTNIFRSPHSLCLPRRDEALYRPYVS